MATLLPPSDRDVLLADVAAAHATLKAHVARDLDGVLSPSQTVCLGAAVTELDLLLESASAEDVRRKQG